MNTPATSPAVNFLAFLVALVAAPPSTPTRDDAGWTLALPCLTAWSVLRAGVRRVTLTLPGKRRPDLAPEVYIASAPMTCPAFDAALRGMLPALRAAGLTPPWQRDLPEGHLVAVARVASVTRTAEGWSIELADVAPLPFACPCPVHQAPRGAMRTRWAGAWTFEAFPAEAAYSLAWTTILDAPRSVEAAAEALTAAGFEPSYSSALAARVVPSIAGNEALEEAAKLARRARQLAPVRARRTSPARLTAAA